MKAEIVTREARASLQSIAQRAAMLTIGSTICPAPSGILYGQEAVRDFSYLIHHHIFNFTYAVLLHIAQRSLKKTVGKAKAKSLKNRISHAVRNARGKAKSQYLGAICSQCKQAPFCNKRPGCRIFPQTGISFHTCSKTAKAPISR